MALCTLAENCDYSTAQEQEIHDRLIIGIWDAKLSQKLQMDPELTLENAKRKYDKRKQLENRTKS